MKKIALLSLSIAMLICCSPKATKKTCTERFEGLTQLVLASETKNVSFTESVKKTALMVISSNAKVEVNSSVTYDFYLDFQNDVYSIEYEQNNKTLIVNAPSIQVKKPVINSSTVSYPERGILVNEDREAVQILESLTDRFVSEGKNLLKQQYVIDKCREKAAEFFLNMSKELALQVKTVKINFPEITD